MSADPAILARLAATIEARRGADPERSHTARLLARGPAKCAQKFGEEAVEAVIEAVRGDPRALAAEGADTLYHFLVMLAAADVPLSAVLDALAAREGVSGVAEKAARGGEVEIHEAVTPEDRARCLALRVEVFIAEQGVSAALEQDGEDPDCTHWIAKRGAETLGAARIKSALPEGWSAGAALIPGATTGTAADAAGDTEAPSQRGSAVPARTGPGAKIQRVAVARRARGTGLGQALMRAMLASHALVAARPVWLEAQVPALGFYERLGFVAEGPEFLDAGMPHRRMILISPRQAPC